MKQTSSLTRNLATAQEEHARQQRNKSYDAHKQASVTFRLYTEDKPNLLTLASRYFTGFTLINAIGVYEGQTELSKVIEIVDTFARLQDVFHLAGDIAEQNNQSAVLITWLPGSAFLYRPEQRTANSYRDKLANPSAETDAAV